MKQKKLAEELEGVIYSFCFILKDLFTDAD